MESRTVCTAFQVGRLGFAQKPWVARAASLFCFQPLRTAGWVLGLVGVGMEWEWWESFFSLEMHLLAHLLDLWVG